MRRRRPERKPKTLRAVRPNAGIAAAYRARIEALVAAMSASYQKWIIAAYRANPPKMAMDALSATEMERELRRMGVYWNARFNGAAPKLATWFAQKASRRSDAALHKILKDAGISVKFKIRPQYRDIMKATVAENVSLIKSIPQQYHTQVEGLVMRSVTAGRDLEYLSKELQRRYGITKKRAALIARDQNNKATSALQRERQTAVGLTEGLWMHSHAGKVPRRTHLANDRKVFNIQEGWFDPDPQVKRNIWPGELINCRCTWRPIVKGFS